MDKISKNEINMIVGKNLKLHRKSKGYTQSSIATKLCMTQQQYSRFENGIFQLNYQDIVSLCEILDITPNDLFDIN